MRQYKDIEVKTRVCSEVTCDVCGKRIWPERGSSLDSQEAVHIEFTGGYGSIFGDESTFAVDLCQHCLKDRLGDVIRCIDDGGPNDSGEIE
jgi:antitoxin CcdA